MEEIRYDKLVRDSIPAIIKANGQTAVVRVLPEPAYARALHAKLLEECTEYLESRELEELADVLEVILAILETRGVSFEHLEALREQKKQKNGGFAMRYFLEKTIRE